MSSVDFVDISEDLQSDNGHKALYTVPVGTVTPQLHCKTAEVHVLLNFKSMESGLVTNVITPTSFYI